MVSDAVVGADDADRVTWLNPAAERLFECTSEEVEGAALDVLLPEPGQARRCDGGVFLVEVTRVGAGVPADGTLLVVRSATESPRALRDLAHELRNAFAVVTTYTTLVLRTVDAASTSDAAVDWSATRRDLDAVAAAAAEGIALCEALVDAGRG